MLIPLNLSAQRIFKGTVRDGQTGEPLPGANVIIKGKQTGTITDLNGEFSISLEDDDKTLVVSYLGYLNEEVGVEGKSTVDVSLLASMEMLEEMVVVGYGTTRRSDLTGSVSSVRGDDIRSMSVTNAAEALQGKVAGAFVSKSSGRPGDEASIKIRGVGSINSINPLWVVDGVQGAPIGNLDNIESVEVLKDASAAAIYGSQAAGGVILVTTKRGSKDKAKISLHSYYSSDRTMNFPELLDANQYSKILLGALLNDSMDISNYNQYYNRTWDRSTDWADVMFQTGNTHNHTLSASGGNENANYFLSGGYMDQKGTYYNTGVSGYNFTVNSDVKVTKWLKVGESVTFTSKTVVPENTEIYRGIFRATPTIPIYDTTNIRGGGFGYMPDSLVTQAGWAGGNPFAHAELYEKYESSNNLFANVYAEIIPFKGLSWRTNAIGRYKWNEEEYFQNPYYHSANTNGQFNILRKDLLNYKNFMVNNYATYALEVGQHSLTLMQGIEAQIHEELKIGTEGRDLPNPNIRNTEMGDPTYLKSTMNNKNGANYSFFGRINYSLMGKYLFTGNYRVDSSDKFGSDYSTGVFPSFSAGWRISKESFMENISFISDLKIRVGWGVLGSDNIPQYNYLSNYGQWGYTGFGNESYPELIPGRKLWLYTNNEIRWEEVKQWNYGVDFAFMNNKLFGSVEYYDKETSNLLVNIALPRTSGFQNARINNGEISNRGVDLTLTWQHRTNDFSFSLSGNAAYNVNKVLNLSDPVGTNFFILKDQSRTEEGHPVASFYGYVADGIIRTQEELDNLNNGSPDGVFQTPGTRLGDIRYKDIASVDVEGNIVMVPDGKITAADQTFIGNPWPKWVYGLTVRAEWKSFDFSMFWQGVHGIDIYNGNKVFTEALYSDYNSSTRLLDAWSAENPNGDIPRVSFNDPNQNFSRISSYFIEDGSYIRLKNVQLGYTLPQKFAQTVGMSNARVYISGINRLTLTRYSGVDPEFVSNNDDNITQMVDFAKNYPQYKSWVFGIQIDF